MLRGLEGGNASLHPAVRLTSQRRERVLNSTSKGPQGKILFLQVPLFPSPTLSTEQLASKESLTEAHRSQADVE